MEQKLLNKLLATFESYTGFHSVIQSDHAYIHAGLAHTVFVETPSSSANYYIGFTTPSVESNKFIHWRPTGIQSSADYVVVKLHEGDSFSGGSAATILNRNRNDQISKPSVMGAFNYGVTTTPTGDVLQIIGMGTDGGRQNTAGGNAGADNELVLAPATNYVVEVIPAGVTAVIMELFWYEENGDPA